MTKRKEVSVSQVIDTMRMIIQWDTMLSYCNSKAGCRDCPYNKSNQCSKKSTVEVLSISAKTFDRFLKQKEHENV